MNHGGVEYFTTLSPTYDHGRNHSPCAESRARTHPFLTPRSSPGPRPHYRTNSLYLTKAGPLRAHYTTEFGRPCPPNLLRPDLDRGRRVRRTQPNPIT